MRGHILTRPRTIAGGIGAMALLGAAAAAPGALGATSHRSPAMPPHVVIASGLDNPRQLQRLAGGDFLVAEAGHGSNHGANCVGSGQDETCVGISGKVARIHDGHVTNVMTGLMSAAGADGTFAVGSDGADRVPGGPYQAIETYAPPSQVPPGLPAGQLGWLLAKQPGGTLYKAGNITRYERIHDPDGEGFDSDPYSVLTLDKHQTLVADAAADDVLSVRDGKVSLWAAMQEYGPKVDPVPTVLAQTPQGAILVGELHSEIPHAAHVWLYNREGQRLRGWPGFTTVTGVARAGNGTLYVSELFGGPCGFDQIPKCFPGRVVKVAPDGTRTHVAVPFPAGIVTIAGRVYVNAFSVSPASGFGGNPAWSGQLWQIFP